MRARDPHHLRLITFHPGPAWHTSGCIDGCRYLWTGGPFRKIPAGYDGQPVWVTDMRDPAHPTTFSTPVDLGRDDGTTAYVHDTDVDAAGIAWTSGLGGVRGYWTRGLHYDPVARRMRLARPDDPVPYAGGKIVSPNDANYTFDHNSWRPLRPLGGFRPGELLLVTDEDFGTTCADAGRLLIVSLAGSHHGEGRRSTPGHPFRLKVVADWGPVGNSGLQPNADCSAHWFQPMPGVGDGDIIVQAFYGQGTRFIDVHDPRHPRQVGYFVPQGTEAATPAFHDGLVYAAVQRRHRRPPLHPARPLSPPERGVSPSDDPGVLTCVGARSGHDGSRWGDRVEGGEVAIAGPLERAIMEAVWDAGKPLLVRELMAAVNAGSVRRPAYTTVQTVADRLVHKGLLNRTADRNAWRYSPTRSREDHVARMMAEALAGAADHGPVLARFAETIDPQDAHRLLMELAQRSAPKERRP